MSVSESATKGTLVGTNEVLTLRRDGSPLLVVNG